jgi:hypothetical protein
VQRQWETTRQTIVFVFLLFKKSNVSYLATLVKGGGVERNSDYLFRINGQKSISLLRGQEEEGLLLDQPTPSYAGYRWGCPETTLLREDLFIYTK